MKTRLNETQIQRLIQEKKEGYFADEGCPGLQLRIGKTRASYYANLRIEGQKVLNRVGRVGEITLSQARLKVHQLRNTGEKPSSKAPLPTSVDETVQGLMDWYITSNGYQNLSERTQADYKRAADFLTTTYGEVLVGDLDINLAQAIYNSVSSKTVAKNHRICWRKAWNDAIKSQRHMGTNPWSNIEGHKIKPRRQMANEEQMKALMETIDQQTVPKTRALFTMIFQTACRKGEAADLRWEDIDEDWVWTKAHTKNSDPQRIKLPQKVIDRLQELPKGKPTDQPLRFSGWSNSWKRIKKDAGLEDLDLHIHDMRRSIAVYLLTNQLVSIKDLSLMLGHRNVKITEDIYAPYLGDNAETISQVAKIYER